MGGFIGGTLFGAEKTKSELQAQIVQSHSALLVLKMLGDDFSRLDRQSLLNQVNALQNQDGRYLAN